MEFLVHHALAVLVDEDHRVAGDGEHAGQVGPTLHRFLEWDRAHPGVVHVAQLRSHRAPDPDEVTLVALSQVLGISLARLRTASSLPADSTEPYTPPAEASRLTRRQRRAVDEMIRAMIEPTTRRGEVADLAARRPAKKATPRAARRGKVEPPRNG